MNETMNFDSDKTMVGVAPGGEATQMMNAPRADATQYAANVNCPVCHTPNSPSERYCGDCGFLLSSSPVDVSELPQPESMGKLVSSDGTIEFPLNPGANSVGREGADVLLSNNSVSRKHGRITIEDAHAFVEDVGSTNGTYVDGAKVGQGEKVELKDGSEVTFGSMALKYHAPEKTEAEPETSSEPTVATTVDDLSAAEEATPVDEPAVDEQASEEPVAEEVASVEPEEPQNKPLASLVSKASGESWKINAGANTIGRRDGVNTIVISDPYCSGRHANIDAQDGVFTITDIGSTNGTLVNGVKLEPNTLRTLQTGDEITLGSPVFRFEVSDE